MTARHSCWKDADSLLVCIDNATKTKRKLCWSLCLCLILLLQRRWLRSTCLWYRFNLMQKCWSFTAEERPCFAYLLQELLHYEEKCAQMSPAEIALHSPTGADGECDCHLHFCLQLSRYTCDNDNLCFKHSSVNACWWMHNMPGRCLVCLKAWERYQLCKHERTSKKNVFAWYEATIN